MKNLYRLLLLLFFTGTIPVITGAQVSVTPSQTAAALAQWLAGPGVTILNPVLTCSPAASGTFRVAGGGLGLDSGIVLTTGRAATDGAFYGVNGASSLLASSNNSEPGDAQLTSLTNGANTYDACRLEFDIVPKGDSIRFDYVFGSEEYINATCGNYNDAFAFFISGPGITGQKNIALVPGTAIPVAVNSINNGIPGPQGNIANCNAMGPGSPFTSYYTDNSSGATFTYKGFTQALRAASAVTPCSTYHLRITIADAGNALYDSGVFLRAGSLQTNTVSIRARGSVSTTPPGLVKGCTGGAFIVRSVRKAVPQKFKYLIGGSAQNGFDYAAIADSVTIAANDSVALIPITGLPTPVAGLRKLTLYLLSPYSCNAATIIDSASLLIYDSLYAKILSPDTVICQGSSITLRTAGDTAWRYSWTPAASLSNPLLQSPVASPQGNTQYVLTVSFPGSGCAPRYDTVQINTSTAPTVSAGPDQSVCAGTPVTFTATLNNHSGAALYDWSGPASFRAVTPSITIPNPEPAQSGLYTVTVRTGGCPPVSDAVLLEVRPKPEKPAYASLLELCLGSSVETLGLTGSSLLWYDTLRGGTGNPQAPQLLTNIIGSSTYYVTQTAAGCESDRREITVRVTKCCEEYLFVPNAFSPNGDGRNDLLRIFKGGEDKLLSCLVFNRWGQVVFEGNEGALSWDGTYQGQPAEVGTYYYQVQIACNNGRITRKTGEVILIR